MKIKILAVDNEKEVIDSIKIAVKAMDEDEIELFVAKSGWDAIIVMERENPDLIISAIDIGLVDGLEVLKEAKKRTIATIVVTSRTDNETAGMIQAYYKPNHYMKKPLDNMLLIKNIRSIFRDGSAHIDGICPEDRELVIKALCDSIDDGIAIIDRNYNVVWINKRLEQKGFLLKDVIGHKSYHVFDEEPALNPEEATPKTFANGKVNKYVKIGRDGHKYRITSIPIKNEEGKVIYAIEFGEDITGVNLSAVA